MGITTGARYPRPESGGDFPQWAIDAAQALEEGRVSDLDLAEVADEIRGLAHGEEY